ncbi:methylmalonyl Co-A mutase-associated GTPase MeaB [Stieleria mannarensis]|uniref:methylmalonyl Co-A mutase-associated GTPase MeaB n=1 Tax=Stieleria mannarensis TaxID=2755585 RepID=UPI0015FF93D9|nr:methylmalonyl Co-A mutase-associated GTPase MeaB [Rhodopirellula sp. JC639]
MKRDVPRRRQLTTEDYFDGVRACDITVLPRALTLIESSNPGHQRQAEALLTQLLPHTGNAIRVGITGAPGAGKSTFIEALGLQLTAQGRRVAVLAVDPSSGISGGSILGDKTRMARLAAEPDAYIRPSPSAGTLGGVASKTRESMLVCEAAGYEVLLIETVGVGQSETMVAEMTDCFLTLMLPGAGDDLQGIKRGLLELVDVIAVNKADDATRKAAEVAAHQYEMAIHSILGKQDNPPRVLTCSALHHQRVDEVWQSIEDRYTAMKADGELVAKRRRQQVRWLWAIIEDRMKQALREHPGVRRIRDSLEADVLDGNLPPEAAASKILEAFGLQDHCGV